MATHYNPTQVLHAMQHMQSHESTLLYIHTQDDKFSMYTKIKKIQQMRFLADSPIIFLQATGSAV